MVALKAIKIAVGRLTGKFFYFCLHAPLNCRIVHNLFRALTYDDDAEESLELTIKGDHYL